MTDNRQIVAVVAVSLLLGILWLGKLAAMGLILFLAVWILITRVPGLRALAERAPLLTDVLGTVGIAFIAPGHGFQKMVAVSIAALALTLWVSYARVRYLARRGNPSLRVHGSPEPEAPRDPAGGPMGERGGGPAIQRA